MALTKVISKAEFESICSCDNMPEMDESICCMYCAHRRTVHITGDPSVVFPKQCCYKYKFELCAWNPWRLRCDGFKSRHD